MRELFIAPAHDHIVRAGCKGLFGNRTGKVSAFKRRIDDENLVVLQIDANAHDESRIRYQ